MVLTCTLFSQGSSVHGSSPSQSPTHTNYQVQSTYFPSDQPETHYVQNQQPDDDPFNLRGSDNPFANTLSGQSEVVAVPDHSSVTINTGERQANVVLQFTGAVLLPCLCPVQQFSSRALPRKPVICCRFPTTNSWSHWKDGRPSASRYVIACQAARSALE